MERDRRPDDVVLHLGDLALGPIAESLPLTAQLYGRRFLVPGNHDRVSPATQSKRAIERFTPLYEDAGWTILPEVVFGTRAGSRILASHYPTPETPRAMIATLRIGLSTAGSLCSTATLTIGRTAPLGTGSTSGLMRSGSRQSS